MKRFIFFVIFSFTVSYTQTVSYDTIQVNTGWNLVGPLDNGAVVNTISTIPPAIIISPFFQYAGQYLASDTLIRGKGYWVKVNAPGIIILQIIGDPCESVLTLYYQGKTYNTIAIGSQCWLRENLNVGVMIDSLQNGTNNAIIEKYCYRNDTVNCIKYGGFYQWNEAMQYTTADSAQGICPSGWHIPSLQEFWVLWRAVGGTSPPLKVRGGGTGSGAGTNTSGFTALFAGFRSVDADFQFFGTGASFWNSTQWGATGAYTMDLSINDEPISLIYVSKNHGFSVRCLKDEN